MQRRAALALLLCALVGGASATLKKHHPKVSGARVSGMRTFGGFMDGVGAGAGADAGAGALAGANAGANASAGAGAGVNAGAGARAGALTRATAGASANAGATTTPVAVPAECQSVAEVAAQAGSFSTLLAAAQAAGLAPALSDRALQATVFAPSDDAFDAALEELGITASQLLAQPELLQAILKYHVVPGAALTADQLSDEQKLPTLLSADLQAAAAAQPAPAWSKKGGAAEEGESGELTIQIQKVLSKLELPSQRITVEGSLSSGVVTATDINAGCPAVVHVIDAVLLPDITEEEEEEGMGSMFGSLKALWGM